MHPSQSDDAAKIVDLMKKIQKRFRTRMLEIPELKDYTLPQIILIHILLEHPGITLTELSQRMSLAKSTVSGIVDRLEEQGLVSRTRPQDNRRTVCLHLTEVCLGKKNGIITMKEAYTREILSKATEDEVNRILEGLAILNRLIGE